MKVKCDYCGRYTKLKNELCPSCGAPLAVPKRKLHPEPAFDDGAAYAEKWPKPSHNNGDCWR